MTLTIWHKQNYCCELDIFIDFSGWEKEIDEEDVTLRRKHRRQSSVGISILSEGRESQRRRSSYTSNSWIRDADDEADELSTRTGRSRPTSWGPIGEIFYRDSLSFCDSERSPMSHHECNFQKKRRGKKETWRSTLSANAKNSLHCNCIITNNTHQSTNEILVKLDFSVHSLYVLYKSDFISHCPLFNGVHIASDPASSNPTATMCTV